MSDKKIEEDKEESQNNLKITVLPSEDKKDKIDPYDIKKSIVAKFNNYLSQHSILEILPTHAKVLSIDRNMSIKTSLSAMCEQKCSQCVVWDELKGEFKGTLMLRNFLEILFNNEHFLNQQAEDAASPSHDTVNEAGDAGQENYVDFINEMEK